MDAQKQAILIGLFIIAIFLIGCESQETLTDSVELQEASQEEIKQNTESITGVKEETAITNDYCEAFLTLDCDPYLAERSKRSDITSPECSTRGYGSWKYCYEQLARFTGDIGYCYNLPEDMWFEKDFKNRCYALATNNKELCNEMSDTYDANNCIFYIDQTKQLISNDFSVCDSLSGKYGHICRTVKFLLHGTNKDYYFPDYEQYIALNESYCLDLFNSHISTIYTKADDCFYGLALVSALS